MKTTSQDELRNVSVFLVILKWSETQIRMYITQIMELKSQECKHV